METEVGEGGRERMEKIVLLLFGKRKDCFKGLTTKLPRSCKAGGGVPKDCQEGVMTKQPRQQWEVEENAGRLWWMRQEKNGGPRDDEAKSWAVGKVENLCYRAP